MLGPIFDDEWDFNRAVVELARECEWKEPFHIPKAAYEAAAKSRGPGIPAGFPDLLLRYRDNEGKSTIIVAELKTDEESSQLSDEQKGFLEDLAPYLPAFVLRPRDWDYIERILREGPPDPTGEIIEPSARLTRSEPLPPPEGTIKAIARNLVQDIGDLYSSGARGDLAELRRMNPDDPDVPAFWKLAARRRLTGNPAMESKWALVMHGIALMTPNAHSGTPVGRALFEGGDSGRRNAFYSNLRLNRLLKAQDSILRTLLTHLFRMLGSAGQPFDWTEMASFILSEGDAAEVACNKIARAYYNTEYRNSQEGNQ